jgi:hypothetical protein
MKFRFMLNGNMVEEVEMSDCETVEHAINTRYGSAADGVTCEVINEGDVNDAQAEGGHGDQAAEGDRDGGGLEAGVRGAGEEGGDASAQG